jgi:anti-sigma B factor antagonist
VTADATSDQDVFDESATPPAPEVREPKPSTFRRLIIDVRGSISVVAFLDEIISMSEHELEVSRELGKLADAGHTQILLNLTNVRYVSSSVLAKLLSLKRRLTQASGTLKVCGIHPDLLAVFRTANFDRVFEIYPDEQSALKAFEGSARE